MKTVWFESDLQGNKETGKGLIVDELSKMGIRDRRHRHHHHHHRRRRRRRRRRHCHHHHHYHHHCHQ